jgi:hypothetical protein
MIEVTKPSQIQLNIDIKKNWVIKAYLKRHRPKSWFVMFQGEAQPVSTSKERHAS